MADKPSMLSLLNILSAFQIVVNVEVEDPWTEAEGEEEVLVLGSRSNLRLCVGPTLFFAPATVEAPVELELNDVTFFLFFSRCSISSLGCTFKSNFESNFAFSLRTLPSSTSKCSPLCLL